MRIFALVSFLVFILAPVPLSAQGGGGNNTSSSTGIGDSSAFQGVTNISEQVAIQGSFIGSGRPSAFVGIDEIYTGSSASSRSSASNNRRTTTTSRPVTRTTAQRRVGMNTGVAQLGRNANNPLVRELTSIDFDIVMSPSRKLPTTVETHLTRIQGIQDIQVMFKDSPVGTTAVLTGTVASERERRVAKQLLLLEPGISQVENLLEVR